MTEPELEEYWNQPLSVDVPPVYDEDELWDMSYE